MSETSQMWKIVVKYDTQTRTYRGFAVYKDRIEVSLSIKGSKDLTEAVSTVCSRFCCREEDLEIDSWSPDES